MNLQLVTNCRTFTLTVVVVVVVERPTKPRKQHVYLQALKLVITFFYRDATKLIFTKRHLLFGPPTLKLGPDNNCWQGLIIMRDNKSLPRERLSKRVVIRFDNYW